MDIVTLLIGLLVGIAVGVFTGMAIGKSRGAGDYSALLESQRQSLKEEYAAREARDREDASRHEREAVERVRQQNEEASRIAREQNDAAMRLMREQHDEAMKAMNKRFEDTVSNMRAEVTSLTEQILKQRQEEFGKASSESICQIVEPLQEKIRQMSEAVKENTKQNTSYSGELKTSIEALQRQSDAARASADRLANALTMNNKGQGNWGEQILTEILTSSGLREGINFETQAFIRDAAGNQVKGDDGKGLQPDVILHLDKGRDIVIDSKVSLTAFWRYQEAQNEIERQQALKDNLASVKNQVKLLSQKDYSKYLQGSLDYVIMFVPVSQALYLATSADHALWREAMEKKVYIADEQTLYAALKIIDLNWKQQLQVENQEKVYGLAKEMLDRVSEFMERYLDVGNSLDKAKKSYDAGMKKLQEGGQSIPTTCTKLIKLGAKSDKVAKTLKNYDIDVNTETPLIEE